MPSPLPHLIVRRTTVKQTPLTPARNILAIRSALLRGDRIVTLHNTSRVLPEHVDNIRVPYHPQHMRHDQLFEWPFGYEFADSSSSHSDQPKQVGRFIELLEWDGFRLEWIKVIGQGGFGIATLWHVIFEDQSHIKVVIKIPVRVNADFDSELDWHLRYGGASHVTQSLDIQAMADDVRRKINRGHMIGRGARFVQTHISVLVLEYAEHGSLYEMMAKASYFNVRFSNKVLWEIWECLVKGVISVALQPDASQRWGSDGLDKVLDSLDVVGNTNEIFRICTLIDSHDVHFDLEEQNILVAEDAKHSHHPIFKLHDFGEFSKRMRECWQHWKEVDYWEVRKCPKTNRYPPETISRDWDKIDLCRPGPVSRFTGDTFGPPRNEVAGRYGTWTNIFMIAKIMEAIITKNWVGHPMSTMDYVSQDRGFTGNSYGWRICRQDHMYIEPELLDLILQCQYEKPADRPQLVYLLRRVCDRKHRGFQESDDETRGFWDDFWSRTKTSPVPPSQDPMTELRGPENHGDNGMPCAQEMNHNIPPSSFAQAGGDHPIPTIAALRRKSHRSPLSMSSSESYMNNAAVATRLPALRRKSHRSPLSMSSSDPSTNLNRRAARNDPEVAARLLSLRRKSHRSPLSVSPAESSMRFSHQRTSMFGQGEGAGPAANPPRYLGIRSSSDDSFSGEGPSRETNRNRRSLAPSAQSESINGEGRSAERRREAQFGGFQTFTNQTGVVSPGSGMDISMGGGQLRGGTISMMDLDEDEGQGDAMDEDK